MRVNESPGQAPTVVNYERAVLRLRDAAERVGWSRANGAGTVPEADIDELVSAAYGLLSQNADEEPPADLPLPHDEQLT